MTIKGSSSRWYEAAVRSGDLAGALAEVYDFPQPLSLDYALGLVVLFGEHDDPRFGRAAAKWTGRFALEHASVDLAVVRSVALALSSLSGGSTAARAALSTATEQHGLRAAGRLLLPDRRQP